MRWKARKPKPEPKPGDTRIIRAFLFLPLTLCGETRWLEWAWIEQVYCEDVGMRCTPAPDWAGWEDVDWAGPPVAMADAEIVRNIDWSKVGYGRRPKAGGANEKPIGERPEPPPGPPRPLAEELIARGLNDICGALKGEH